MRVVPYPSLIDHDNNIRLFSAHCVKEMLRLRKDFVKCHFNLITIYENFSANCHENVIFNKNVAL
jgi:hypothetical protein